MTEVIAALDRVFGGFTPEDGVSDEELDAAEKRLGVALPRALRALYRATGRHPFHSAEHYLVPPAELGFNGDRLIVYVENQRVCVWGIARDALAEDDPPVQVSITQASGTTFEPEFESVSDFLSFQAAEQAVAVLPFAGLVFDRDRVASRRIAIGELGPLLGDRLALASTREVRVRPGAIALLGSGSYFSTAALDEAAFRHTEAVAGLHPRAWDFLAPRDR